MDNHQPHPPHRPRLLLAAVFAAAVALRLAMAFVIAPLQAPDEAAHLRYVQTLGDTGHLPVQPRATWPNWEQYYQPPLAYGVFVAVDRITGAASLPEPDRLRALRIVNALLGSAIVPIAYTVVRRLVPAGDWRPLLAALVIALFPGFAGSASVLNNDTLSNLLAAALWMPLLSGGAPRRTAVAAGLLLGAACLAKLSVLALAPLLVIVPLCKDPRSLTGALRYATMAGAVVALVLLPWMVRNYAVYGSPLAIDVGSISYASLSDVLPEAAVAAASRAQPGRAFLQFWGQFGVYNNLHWKMIPFVLVPLASLALIGWARRAPAADGSFTRAAVAALAALALAITGLTAFSLRYWAAWQGRYLYTTAVPVAMLLAGGWHHIVPARLRGAFILMLAAGLLTLDTILVLRLHGFFTAMPSARWPFTAEL